MTNIDDHAKDMFEQMGYETVPDSILKLYREVKRRKDKLHPGRMTPEGFALIATLGEMAIGGIQLNETSEVE